MTFRTIVTELPASPLGLLPARWVVEHWCRVCRERVGPDKLVTDAQAHERHIQQEGGTIE